ncbi:MAG: dihydropteroate synthase [Betaproteobacteria bacterium]|nr:dihydropteroate synthase [Betaproteobacteria bacterium]
MSSEGAAVPPLVVPGSARTLRCGRFHLSLAQPLIMGIVNVTPDSFSDGGSYLDAGKAIAHAQELASQGAAIVDLGGESSRPGAEPVPLEEEWMRLLPVLTGLRDIGVPISVDTVKPEIMRRAIDVGASMINDISALRTRGTMEAASNASVAVCLMHMQGDPRTMQHAPSYDNVVGEVAEFLSERAREAESAGIGHDRIVLDPGFGFGKRSRHNLALLRDLDAIAGLGYPVLAGLSRKSLLGAVTGRPRPGRLAASLAAAVLAVQRGASILRVHDIAETRDALLMIKVLEDPDNYLD